MTGLLRFLRALSEIKYNSYLNQNGGTKMTDASKSFFNNKWRHHDITVIVQLLDIVRHLTVHVFFAMRRKIGL